MGEYIRFAILLKIRINGKWFENVSAEPIMMLLLRFVTDTSKAQHIRWWWTYGGSDSWRKCSQVLCIRALTSQEKGTAKTWGCGITSLPYLLCKALLL